MLVDDYLNVYKRHLLFRRKVMADLDNVLKSRDITLLTKGHIVELGIFQ